MAHPLEGSKVRVDRAGQHLTDLEAEIEGFFAAHESSPVFVELKSSRYIELKLERPGVEPPLTFSVLIGEIVYNLRAALDYLVYELAAHDSGKEQDGTQFLIEDCPDVFESKRKTKLKGLSDEHVAAIKVLQPYKGSKWTATLRNLSNPDKHRKLTALAAFDSQLDIRRVVRAGDGSKTYAQIGALFGSGQLLNPSGAREMNVSLDFALDIAFDQGTLVVQTLKELQAEVGNTLAEFESEFER